MGGGGGGQATWFIRRSKQLTHTEEVQRLYRAALRLAGSWAPSVDIFEYEADRIRDRFEANRHLTSPIRIGGALDAARAELKAKAHPSPYILPWMPDGSMYMRNSPPPVEVTHPGANKKSPVIPPNT